MDFDEVFPSLFASALTAIIALGLLGALGVTGFFLWAGAATAFVLMFWVMWEYN